MSSTNVSTTQQKGLLPTTLEQLQRHLISLQQTRSQIFHGWSMLFLIMLRSEGDARVRDAVQRPSPLPATTLALYQRAISLITGQPIVPQYLDDGTPAPVANPGLTPADFNTLVSTTVVSRLQRVNEAFRAVTAPPTDAPNPFESAVASLLKDSTAASTRFVKWCNDMQAVEKRRFELVVTYQQMVISHLSETVPEDANHTYTHSHGGGGCCHEAAKIKHLPNTCVFVKQVAIDAASPLPSSLVSHQVVLSEGIHRGIQWADPSTIPATSSSGGGMAVSDSDEDEEYAEKRKVVNFQDKAVVSTKSATTLEQHPCAVLGAWVSNALKELSSLATTMTDLVDEANEELADSS